MGCDKRTPNKLLPRQPAEMKGLDDGVDMGLHCMKHCHYFESVNGGREALRRKNWKPISKNNMACWMFPG